MLTAANYQQTTLLDSSISPNHHLHKSAYIPTFYQTMTAFESSGDFFAALSTITNNVIVNAFNSLPLEEKLHLWDLRKTSADEGDHLKRLEFATAFLSACVKYDTLSLDDIMEQLFNDFENPYKGLDDPDEKTILLFSKTLTLLTIKNGHFDLGTFKTFRGECLSLFRQANLSRTGINVFTRITIKFINSNTKSLFLAFKNSVLTAYSSTTDKHYQHDYAAHVINIFLFCHMISSLCAWLDTLPYTFLFDYVNTRKGRERLILLTYTSDQFKQYYFIEKKFDHTSPPQSIMLQALSQFSNAKRYIFDTILTLYALPLQFQADFFNTLTSRISILPMLICQHPERLIEIIRHYPQPITTKLSREVLINLIECFHLSSSEFDRIKLELIPLIVNQLPENTRVAFLNDINMTEEEYFYVNPQNTHEKIIMQSCKDSLLRLLRRYKYDAMPAEDEIKDIIIRLTDLAHSLFVAQEKEPVSLPTNYLEIDQLAQISHFTQDQLKKYNALMGLERARVVIKDDLYELADDQTISLGQCLVLFVQAITSSDYKLTYEENNKTIVREVSEIDRLDHVIALLKVLSSHPNKDLIAEPPYYKICITGLIQALLETLEFFHPDVKLIRLSSESNKARFQQASENLQAIFKKVFQKIPLAHARHVIRAALIQEDFSEDVLKNILSNNNSDNINQPWLRTFALDVKAQLTSTYPELHPEQVDDLVLNIVYFTPEIEPGFSTLHGTFAKMNISEEPLSPITLRAGVKR